MKTKLPAVFLVLALRLDCPHELRAQDSRLEAEIRSRAAAVEKRIITWREDIHQHPELGEQEVRTSTLVADHLRNLGLEVHTNIAHTGVVGLLRGAKPGRTVALRADMDALPVKEPGGLPFAEEGPSLFEPTPDKSWGARLMLQKGIFKQPKPDAVFAAYLFSRGNVASGRLPAALKREPSLGGRIGQPGNVCVTGASPSARTNKRPCICRFAGAAGRRATYNPAASTLYC